VAGAATSSTTIPAGASETDALLKRAYLVLEDSDWQKADELLEQVLNRDPENARAYFGKVMVQLQSPSEEKLWTRLLDQPNVSWPLINENKNYQKALRYADSKYLQELEPFTRKEEHIYQRAVHAVSTASHSH